MAASAFEASGHRPASHWTIAVEQDERSGRVVQGDPLCRSAEPVRGLAKNCPQGAAYSLCRGEYWREPQKAGVLPQDADAFLAACRDKYGLGISGLMCIPPLDEAPGPHFALTAKIAKRNGLKLLSMGMSADFSTAIALGATHIRVGSAIFGERAK